MRPLLCYVDLAVCYGIALTQLPSRGVYFNKFCPKIFKFLISNASQPERPIRFYEGLTLEMSAFETLYGGQFTLSTQLIKANYLIIGFLLTFYCYYSFSAHLKQQSIIQRQLSRDDTLENPKYDDAGSDCSPAGIMFVQSQSENDKLLLLSVHILFAFLD